MIKNWGTKFNTSSISIESDIGIISDFIPELLCVFRN